MKFFEHRSFVLCLFTLLLADLILAAPLCGADWVFPAAPRGHRGSVSAVIQKGDTIISAGEDGFLGLWNLYSGATVDRFQISRHRIIAMAGRPGKDEVCAVENDGLGLYWISVWNYRERRKIFTLQFRDAIGYISYSAGGNFIIAARTGRTALVMIDSNSGAVLQSPQSLTGTIDIAITGSSERNMMVYLTSGEISYWDIRTGNRTNVLNVPANMRSTAIFSNNRYLAGINAQGLWVVHATSGMELGRDSSIPSGSLLCADGDDIICLVQKNNAAAELYRFTIDNSGRLVTRKNFSVTVYGMSHRFTAIGAGSGGSAFFGTSDGSLISAASDGRVSLLSAKEQTLITDAAVSGSTLAFISENGIGFIPLDHQQLYDGSSLRIEKNDTAYNRVTAFNAGPEQENNSDQFIFWHDKNVRLQPAIRSSEPGSQFQVLNRINAKAPIHSAASFGGKALFLDTIGNLYVTAADKIFTFFSVGLMGAAFIDSNRLMLGRSAVSGNTPFMTINLNTGETVPLRHSSQAAAALYRGSSGNIYAVTVSSQPAEGIRQTGEATATRTQVMLLNPSNISASIKLIDFPGEDTQFSLAETSGGLTLAANIGGEDAAIYSSAGTQKLDRSCGLPLRLMEGGSSLVSLDQDGNICWYDSRSGRLSAIFSLTPSGWTLRTERRSVSGHYQ